MSGTGILADTVAVDCAGCGFALLAPIRLASEASGVRCYQCQVAADAVECRREAEKRLATATGEKRWGR